MRLARRERWVFRLARSRLPAFADRDRRLVDGGAPSVRWTRRGLARKRLAMDGALLSALTRIFVTSL
jgi:phosphohistidine phosphatase SixA